MERISYNLSIYYRPIQKLFGIIFFMEPIGKLWIKSYYFVAESFFKDKITTYALNYRLIQAVTMKTILDDIIMTTR